MTITLAVLTTGGRLVIALSALWACAFLYALWVIFCIAMCCACLVEEAPPRAAPHPPRRFSDAEHGLP